MFLTGVCVCVLSQCVQLCNRSAPGSSVHRILWQECWSGLLFPSVGDLPNPGIEPTSPVSPCVVGGFFTH